jgi:hypothetical protein
MTVPAGATARFGAVRPDGERGACVRYPVSRALGPEYAHRPPGWVVARCKVSLPFVEVVAIVASVGSVWSQEKWVCFR